MLYKKMILLGFICIDICLASSTCQGLQQNEIVCCTGYFWNTEKKICQKCAIGLYGVNCSEKCPYPSFGNDCQFECKCPPNLCNFASGCTVSTAAVKCSENVGNCKSVNIVTDVLTELHLSTVNNNAKSTAKIDHPNRITTIEENKSTLFVLSGLIGVFGTLFCVFFTMYLKNKHYQESPSQQATSKNNIQETIDNSTSRQISSLEASPNMDSAYILPSSVETNPRYQPNHIYEDIEFEGMTTEDFNMLPSKNKGLELNKNDTYLTPL